MTQPSSRRLRPTPWAVAFGMAVATMAGVPSVHAQQAAADKADDPSTVVVTARKRVERLQDVPLAITAINAKVLEDAGVRTTQDIVNLTPGLSLTSAGSEAQLNPVIRGISNLNTAGDPTVAIFLDGIYLANSSSVSLGMIAMERVEVVKGPVSALYGRNAFGGAINYVSKRPSKTLEANAELGVSQHGGRTLTASVSGSVVPNLLTARVTLGYDKTDGTWTDAVNGVTAGGYKKKDGMVSFSLTPSKTLSVDGSVYFGNDTFGQAPFGVTGTNCGAVSPLGPALYGTTVLRQFCGELALDEVQIPKLNPAAAVVGNDRDVLSANVRLSADVGFGDLTVLLGYNDVTTRRLNDFTGKRAGLPFQVINPAGINFQSVQFGNNSNNSDSQAEIRLASKQNQAFRWQGGLNWFDGKAAVGTLVGTDISGLLPGQSMASAFNQSCFGSTTGGFGPCFGDTRRTDKVVSPFAALEADVMPALTLAGEFRHTQQTKGQEILRNTSSAVSPPAGLGEAAGFKSQEFTFDNYRASARYKISPDAMVYAAYADGTKAGGFNAAATVPQDLTFDPETSSTVEVGGKFSLMDRKLQVGVAVFSIKTKDVQISGPSSNPASLSLVTKNFGKTKSQGIEVDFAAAPAPGWRINGGFGYSDPKFTDNSYDFTIVAADCQAIEMCRTRQVGVTSPSGVRQALDLNGLHVPRTSNLTANLGLQYNGSLPGDWGWFARADLRYESKRYTTQTNWSWIPERTLLNLRAGLESGRYRFTVYVNNATNDTTPDGALPSNRLNDGVPVLGAAMPVKRTIGMTAGISFF